MRKRKFVFITFITSNLSIFSSNFIIIVLEFTFAQQKNTVSNTVNLLTKIQKTNHCVRMLMQSIIIYSINSFIFKLNIIKS